MGRLRRLKKPECRVNQGPNLISFWVNELASQKARCIRRHSDNNPDNNQAKKDLRSNLGFSLVELIIVIAIIAILAAAIAPALIRYIDKSRKAIDIANAELIYKAAEMAATTGSDDAAVGWTIPTTTNGGNVARTWVTPNGHRKDKESGVPQSQCYEIACIAWARGLNYNQNGGEWQNAKFKGTMDSSQIGSDGWYIRRYTNEFLAMLLHEDAKDGIYNGYAGTNVFDGFSEQTILFKYRKDAGMGVAECWMVCVRCDTLTPEIWIGDKNLNGRGANQKVKPLYRIYPDPCIEYAE